MGYGAIIYKLLRGRHGRDRMVVGSYNYLSNKRISALT